MAFSGRKWQAAKRFRPTEWPFRAGSGTREAIPAREWAFSGRRGQKGGILWAGPLLGVSFQAPQAAKKGFFVVRGAAHDTPNDSRIRYDGDSRDWLCHDGSEKSNREAEKATEAEKAEGQGPGGISSDSGPLFRSVGAEHQQPRILSQNGGTKHWQLQSPAPECRSGASTAANPVPEWRNQALATAKPRPRMSERSINSRGSCPRTEERSISNVKPRSRMSERNCRLLPPSLPHRSRAAGGIPCPPITARQKPPTRKRYGSRPGRNGR